MSLDEYKKMSEEYDIDQQFQNALLTVNTERELRKLSNELSIKELEEKMNKLLDFGMVELDELSKLSAMLGKLNLKTSPNDPLKERIEQLKHKLNLLEGKGKPRQKMPLSRRKSAKQAHHLNFPRGVVSSRQDLQKEKEVKEDIKKRVLQGFRLRKSVRKSQRVSRKSPRKSQRVSHKSPRVSRKSSNNSSRKSSRKSQRVSRK